MQRLLDLLAALDTGDGDREVLTDRLRVFHEAATAGVAGLRDQLAVAEGFAATLAGRLGGPSS